MVRLRMVEAVAAVAIEGPLLAAAALGLPDGFRLDGDERIAELARAVEHSPREWIDWLLDEIPPCNVVATDPTIRAVETLLSASREALRFKLLS